MLSALSVMQSVAFSSKNTIAHASKVTFGKSSDEPDDDDDTHNGDHGVGGPSFSGKPHVNTRFSTLA